MSALVARLQGVILPAWVKWAVLLVLLLAAYGLGRVHEARHGADAMIDYIAKQAAQTTRIAKAQVQVVHETEIKYRDRIQTVYVKGDEIEKLVPQYVTPGDDQRFGVNAGFVRVLDAAWGLQPAAAPAESDREPAGVSLSDVAANEADNATACRAWREQALGVREVYERLRAVTNPGTGEQR